jgi:hypothetical protein
MQPVSSTSISSNTLFLIILTSTLKITPEEAESK